MLGPGPRSSRRGGIKFRTGISLQSTEKAEVEAQMKKVRSSLDLDLDLSLTRQERFSV
jgi:hypothetical protein